MAKETFYFSHDYNTRSDDKIKKLIRTHGMIGYGVFWAIVEDLYNNANALPTDYECIAFDLRTNPDIIKSIINDFDLFIIEKQTFGSSSVERRLEDRNKKSIKARKSALKRWGNKEEDANALPTQSDSNAIKERKIKERKIKERKVKEIKYNFKQSLIDLGVSEDLVNDFLVVRKNKKLSNTETAFKWLKKEIEQTDYSANDIIKVCVEKSWGGFQKDWIKNVSIVKSEIPPFEFDFKKHGGDLNLFNKLKLEHERKYS